MLFNQQYKQYQEIKLLINNIHTNGLNTSFNVKCIEKIFEIITLNDFHSILTAKITENSHFHCFNFFLTSVHLIEKSEKIC